MKKWILLVATATFMTGAAWAQDAPSAKKGDFGTEISFNPFNQNGNTFSLDALNLRYFITDHDAVRLSLGFGITKETIKDDDTVDDYVNTTKGDFSIDLGYERHFKIANRLSLYAGGEVGFLSHFASGKGKTTIAGAITTVDFKNITTINGDRAYAAFTAGIFTGLDFYVYKGLYVGAELGLYMQTGKTLKAEAVTTVGDVTSITKYNNSTTTTSCQFGVTPSVRLGWTF